MPGEKDLMGDTPDDDASSGRDDSMQPEDAHGKGGASSQIRKAQNRIAQREFRLRKQQYIRDLEARVEVLSGDKEERVELMTLLVRNLLKENKELRGMVKSMAAFVGEGLGSCLPRLGLSADQLDAILNRADTDTAYEAFINLKASRELESANPGIILGEPRRKNSTIKRKRGDEDGDTPAGGSEPPESGPSHSNSKRRDLSASGKSLKRTKSDEGVHASTSDEYAYLFPDLTGILMGPGGGYGDPSIQRFDPTPTTAEMQQHSQQRVGQGMPRQDYSQRGFSPNVNNAGYGFTTYPDISSGFGLTLPPNVGPGGPLLNTGTGVGPSGLRQTDQPSSERIDHPASPPLQMYTPQARSQGPPPPVSKMARHSRQEQVMRKTMDTMTQGGTSHPFEGPGMSAIERNERRRAQESLIKSIEEGDPSDRKLEAMQLITYHLNNFRLNHDYHLPSSLRPTVVQRTVDHEHAIDGVCFPAIRDRMIMLRGQYDLIEVFHAILSEFTLHGDDVLDHRSYEVSEKFIRDYDFLVDKSVVDVSNKWRSLRGDPPLIWNGAGGGKRLNSGQGPAEI